MEQTYISVIHTLVVYLNLHCLRWLQAAPQIYFLWKAHVERSLSHNLTFLRVINHLVNALGACAHCECLDYAKVSIKDSHCRQLRPSCHGNNQVISS